MKISKSDFEKLKKYKYEVNIHEYLPNGETGKQEKFYRRTKEGTNVYVQNKIKDFITKKTKNRLSIQIYKLTFNKKEYKNKVTKDINYFIERELISNIGK